MSFTHYYYALNHKAAERICGLTWNQFVKKFGWGLPLIQWKKIGGYLSFGLDRPILPEECRIQSTIPRQ